MREHDRIVADLKQQLKAKGIKIVPLNREKAMVTVEGFTINSKTEITAFIPDIIVNASDASEDLICIDYVHTKRQLRADVRGLMLLSLRGYCKYSNLVLNDSIIKYDRGIAENTNIQQMGLSIFKKYLERDSKEGFVGFLRG